MKPLSSRRAAALAAIVVAVSSGAFPLNHAMAQKNDSNDGDVRSKLTPEQYRVTKECGTEPPFRNAYWDNHKPGIYVDIISGKPLFTSLDKFDSGSGWPSFTKPIAKDKVVEKTDKTFGMARTEVRSSASDSHLGHVFDDGPRDKGGMRYCINSAALRFVPLEKLKEEGYAEFLPLFEKQKDATAAK